MKSFARWSATLGLIGGTLLTSWLGQILPALALPQEEVIKLLQPVAVFTLADTKGVPLVGVVKDKEGKDALITTVFISRQDAQQFFQQLQKDKPEIANKFQVQIVSLGDVYKLESTNASKPDRLNFIYQPMQDEVEVAKKLLSENGQQYQGGVPLFVARGGKEQGYLTIQQNNEAIIPVFFEKEQLQPMVDQFKKQNPDLASTVKIEVIPLEAMLATLGEKNDDVLKKFRLWPSQETIKYIQSLQTQQNQTQPKK